MAAKPLTESQRQLVADHMWLVTHMLHKVLRVSTLPPPIQEAVTDGVYTGLINSAKSFDKSRGIKFSSYAGVGMYRHAIQKRERETKRLQRQLDYYLEEIGKPISRPAKHLQLRDLCDELLVVIDKVCKGDAVCRDLLRLRYGANGESPMSVKDAAAQLNIPYRKACMLVSSKECRLSQLFHKKIFG